MDIATRFQPRTRGQSFLEREKETEATQGRMEDPFSRRKSSRPGASNSNDDSNTFRKPSLPASATRQPTTSHQKHPSASYTGNGGVSSYANAAQYRQRTRAATRDSRVPSGPRDYPSSPGKRIISTDSTHAHPATNGPPSNLQKPSLSTAIAPDMPFSANHTFAFSPQEELTRGIFGSPAEDPSEPGTPASQRDRNNSASMDFLPSVNFDEFQSSLSTLDTNNQINSNLYDEFPVAGSTRILRSDTTQAAKAMGKRSLEQDRSSSVGRRLSLSRGNSFRERKTDRTSKLPNDTKSFLSTATSSSGPGPIARATAAFKARRQSNASTLISDDNQRPNKATKPLRSAFGANSTSHVQTPSTGLVQPPKHASKVSAFNSASSTEATKSRRITMSNFDAEQSRVHAASTLQPGSRRTKGLSLLPPSSEPDPNTPTTKLSSKGAARSRTPSSSGNTNRRQSIASGRLSGLGARTISPTDTRRQKRLSMAPQQPPMPLHAHGSKLSPGEELSMQQHLRRHERKASLPRSTTVPNVTATSRRDMGSTIASDPARFSTGDVAATLNKFGYPFSSVPSASGQGGLSAKSSYASLHTASSATNATNVPSRVPILRSRTAASSATAGSSGDESQTSTEVIPPVPAIPKAYDSPKDAEPLPFGQLGLMSKTRKASASHLYHSQAEGSDADYLNSELSWRDIGRASFDSDRTRGSASKKSVVAAHENQARPLPHTSTSTGPLGTSASFSGFPQHSYANEHGRQNGNLQPPRLPPLNLVPLTLPHRHVNGDKSEAGPHPSQELDDRHYAYAANGKQTPDWPRHGHKTPSTPMTASKATFMRRAPDGDGKHGIAARSSTSHFALRDAVGLEPDAMRTGWLDDSDDDAHARGISIGTPYGAHMSQSTATSRNAITPFASGSLPKGSGEFVRYHGQSSVDWTDDYTFSHHSRQPEPHVQTKIMPKTSRPSVGSLAGSLSSLQSPADSEQRSPATETAEKDTPTNKKEGSGLRRKLSLGWRRSSSKAANHADNQKGTDADTPKSTKDVARTSSMIPPKLPASVAFNGDGSLGIPLSARPSLDGNEPTSLSDRLRRRTFMHAKQAAQRDDVENAPDDTNVPTMQNNMEILEVPPPKTRSLHSERPQPVSNNRSSSWGNHNRASVAVKPHLTQPKPTQHNRAASSINVLVKDGDDLAADEEMRRLTQKKKDVDNVAKMTDELMHRAAPRDAINIDQVMHDRHFPLNIFERGEVIEYENEGIYFTGTMNAKKIVGSLHPSSQPADMKGSDKSGKSGNFGYDDERGDYNIVIGDHLAYRYEVCDVLGKGSFGQVVRCIDHKEGGVVAIKIIRNKKRFHQQALVEVGILGKLRDWDPDGAHATLSITGSFYFRSHLCIVTPCLSINLYELIRAHNFSGFSLPLIRRFARQLLACLVLLQEKRVIHCDLKPENILLCSARAADVRVIDFGSSCREEEKVYTYIQSRFYRSPEVILGSSYGLGIDMWSFGCILAELWTGYPIFPGENEQEQLACIMEIFGPPDRHLVERCTRKKLFFDSVGKPRVTVSSKGRRRRPSSKTLQQALKTEDEAFVDFIARCLRWDPDRRLKPHEACAHAFVTNQPLNQRPGIPDEARRAARVRSAAAVPATATASSPVKRTQAQHAATSSVQSAVTAATPHKTVPVTKQMPDTPQTALRAPTINTSSTLQSSPAKAAGNRRQSNLASAGSAAALKRQSNAAVMTGSTGLPSSKTTPALGSLAEKAARESMATASNTAGNLSANSSGRWRV